MLAKGKILTCCIMRALGSAWDLDQRSALGCPSFSAMAAVLPTMPIGGWHVQWADRYWGDLGLLLVPQPDLAPALLLTITRYTN